jgi:hypothetical protein
VSEVEQAYAELKNLWNLKMRKGDKIQESLLRQQTKMEAEKARNRAWGRRGVA